MEQVITKEKQKELVSSALKGVAIIAGAYYGLQVLTYGYDIAKSSVIAARKQAITSLIQYDWEGKEITLDLRAGKKARLGESLSRDDLERTLFVSLNRLEQCNFDKESALQYLR